MKYPIMIPHFKTENNFFIVMGFFSILVVIWLCYDKE